MMYVHTVRRLVPDLYSIHSYPQGQILANLKAMDSEWFAKNCMGRSKKVIIAPLLNRKCCCPYFVIFFFLQLVVDWFSTCLQTFARCSDCPILILSQSLKTDMLIDYSPYTCCTRALNNIFVSQND